MPFFENGCLLQRTHVNYGLVTQLLKIVQDLNNQTHFGKWAGAVEQKDPGESGLPLKLRMYIVNFMKILKISFSY